MSSALEPSVPGRFSSTPSSHLRNTNANITTPSTSTSTSTSTLTAAAADRRQAQSELEANLVELGLLGRKRRKASRTSHKTKHKAVESGGPLRADRTHLGRCLGPQARS